MNLRIDISTLLCRAGFSVANKTKSIVLGRGIAETVGCQVKTEVVGLVGRQGIAHSSFCIKCLVNELNE